MNEEKVKYIFECLEKSEVSLVDFSRLTQISRNSLHRWKRTEEAHDKLRLHIAYTAAQRLEAACREGYLPLVDRLKKDKRFDVIRKIVAQMATK